ncbi:MAG: SurA N-terminal domain-containing protein [Ornithinimicrobium sp.]
MSHFTFTRLTTTALVVVVSAALTACSGDSSTADDASQTSTGVDDASQTSIGDSAAATSAGPNAGGDLPEPDVADLPDVLATVNGEEIAQDEFITAYEPQFAQAAVQAQQAGTEVDQAQLKQQTLDYMVNNVLLLQAADEAGIEISTREIDADIEELAASNGAGSAKDFFAALEEEGFTEEEVRTEVGKQLKIEKFLADNADTTQPSEQEIRDLYDELSAQQESAGEDAASATIPPFDQVQAQLEEQLLQEAQSAAVDDLLTDLRATADITTNL